MSLTGPISNSAGSPGNKDLVEAYAPILLVTISFTDNVTVLYLCTHPLNTAEGGYPYGGNNYLARMLDENIAAVQAMSDTGIDIPPTITLQMADADRFLWTNYEKTIGFKGATVTLDLVLWEADTANFSSDAYRKFAGICDSANVEETTLTVSATSKLNMQKAMLPLIAVQTRCPWVFPPADLVPLSYLNQSDGLGNIDSPYYPCGYSAGVANGYGNKSSPNQADATGVAGTLTDANGCYLQCDYTAAGCATRGMYTKDTSTTRPPPALEAGGGTPSVSLQGETGHFGGVQWDPPLWWKGKGYITGSTASGINAQMDARYATFLPLVYGQVFVDGVVLNVVGDANSTRMEVLICYGDIGGASLAAMNSGGVQMVICSGVAVPYNFQQVGGGPPAGQANATIMRWQYVNTGTRDSMANVDAGYTNSPNTDFTGLSDPYGNIAVIEVVLPLAALTSQTVPAVQILTIGPKIRVYSSPSAYTLLSVGAVTGQGNPIWILMDLFIRAGWTYDLFNIQTFIDAAAVCDVQINYTNNAGVLTNYNTGTFPGNPSAQTPHIRYSCSLQIPKRRTGADVIQGVRNSCKAIIVPNDKTGLLQVFIKQTMADQQPAPIAGSNNGTGIVSMNAARTAEYGYSAYDFDESSILTSENGASTLKITQRSVHNSPNSMTATFQDQDNQFVVDSMTEVDPDDCGRAGQTVGGSMNVDGLNNFDQGQRVFETNFAETFRGNPRGDSGGTLIFAFQTTQKIVHLQVGNICRFSHQQLGISFQMVRVISLAPSRDYETTTIQLQWHQDFWYTDTYGQINSPVYSTQNKTQLLRPPFAWQPHAQQPLSSDLMVDPTNFTFDMTLVYSTDASGNPVVTLTVGGLQPINLSSTLSAPLIALQGPVASGGGTIGAGKVIYAVVCPFDGNTPPDFAMPETSPCMMATPPGGSNYTVTIPVALWQQKALVAGYNVYAGPDAFSMTYQGNTASLTAGNPTPASITLPALNVRTFGPPDIMYDHMRLRVKEQIHGGTWGAAVHEVTATTLKFDGAMWTVNMWAGCDLTITGRYQFAGSLPCWNLRVLSNTVDTLTFGANPNGAGTDLTNLVPTNPAGFRGINPDDAAVMRTLPTTFTALTLGDSKFINSTTPNEPSTTIGLTVNEGMAATPQRAFILRIYAGTGAGQWRNVASNTTTVYTVDQPFDTVPDATSRFWIEDANWQWADSAQVQNSTLAAYFSGSLQVTNYNAESIVVQALTMDVNDNPCFEQYAPIRDAFVYGAQGTRNIGSSQTGFVTDRIIDGDCTAGNIVYQMLPFVQIGNQSLFFQKIDASTNTFEILCDPGVSYTITAASWLASVATVTIGAHTISAGEYFTVSGVLPVGWNAANVVATSITPTTVSYALAVNPGAWVSGGTAAVLDLINGQASVTLTNQWDSIVVTISEG